MTSVATDKDWGVYDTWTSRWCPLPRLNYIQATNTAGEYNLKEDPGMKRYETRRLDG